MTEYKVPTPEEIDLLTRRAHEMRAEAIRKTVHNAAQGISNLARRLFARRGHAHG